MRCAADVSDLQVEAGETAQVEVQVEQRRPADRHAAAGGGAPRRARGVHSGSWSHRCRPGRTTTAAVPREDRAPGALPAGTDARARRPTRSAWSTSTRRCRPPRAILVTPRTEPLPRIALTGRWAGAGDNRTRDLLGGGSPDVTHPGVPPRRRPAPDPLAEQRPRRPADGAARGAAVAVPVHAADRQPPHLPPRLRRGLLDGDGGPRGRVDHAQPGRARLRGPAGQRHRALLRARLAPGRPRGRPCPSSSSAWP